jgi:hypothetical protein
VVVASGLLVCAALALPGVVPNGWLLFAALALGGLGDGAQDVAMNAQGVALERRRDTPTMIALHGWWSVGAGAGALLGAGAAAARVPVALHLAVTGAVLALLLLSARPSLLAAPPPVAPAVAPRRHVAAPAALLGVAAVTAAVLESIPFDWSALYLADALSAPPGVAGAAFAAFSTAMVAARFVGDAVSVRIGTVALLRGSALVALSGFALTLVVPVPAAGLVGFALVGLGAAVVFPTLFATAGDPRQIALVATVSRLGFLAAPPLVGAVATTTGLRAAPALGLLASLAMALLAGVVRRR